MSTILLKRSNIAGAIPAANQLELGELAVNIADAKLFLKNAAGQVITFSAGPGVDPNSFLAKTSNLADLDNVSTARSNLGLGSVATQNANSVAFTGGSIANLSALSTTGDATFGGKVLVGNGIGSADAGIEIGSGRTAGGLAYIDFISDTTNTDYGFRISRNAGGAVKFTSQSGSFMTFEQAAGSTYDFKVNGSSVFNVSSSSLIGQAPLTLSLGSLGSVAGNTLPLATFASYNSSQFYLKFFTRRSADGVTSSTATTRIQQTAGSTDQGYVEFNTLGTDGEVIIGTPSIQMGRFSSESGSTSTLHVPKLKATSGQSSSSTTTGALIVAGGMGVSGTVYAGSVNVSSSKIITHAVFPRPNIVINGDFGINNDPKMGTAVTGLNYINDVWLYNAGSGTCTPTIQPITSLETDFDTHPSKCLQLSQSVASSTAPYLAQRIENARIFGRRKLGLTLRIRAVSAPSFPLSVSFSLALCSAGSTNPEINISPTNVYSGWGTYSTTLTLSMPSDFNYSDLNSYLELRIKFPANTTFVVQVSHIKLEDVGNNGTSGGAGDVTQFVPNPPAIEQALIDRYYQVVTCTARQYTAAAAYLEAPVPYRSVMRKAPIASLLSAGYRNNLASGWPGLFDLTTDGGRFVILSAGTGDTYAAGDKYILDARL